MESMYKRICNELNLINCQLDFILMGYKSEDMLDKLSNEDYLQYLLLRKREEELRLQKKIITTLNLVK